MRPARTLAEGLGAGGGRCHLCQAEVVVVGGKAGLRNRRVEEGVYMHARGWGLTRADYGACRCSDAARALKTYADRTMTVWRLLVGCGLNAVYDVVTSWHAPVSSLSHI